MSFIISSANNEVQRLTEGTDRFLRRREDGVGEVGAVCFQKKNLLSTICTPRKYVSINNVPPLHPLKELLGCVIA